MISTNNLTIQFLVELLSEVIAECPGRKARDRSPFLKERLGCSCRLRPRNLESRPLPLANACSSLLQHLLFFRVDALFVVDILSTTMDEETLSEANEQTDCVPETPKRAFRLDNEQRQSTPGIVPSPCMQELDENDELGEVDAVKSTQDEFASVRWYV